MGRNETEAMKSFEDLEKEASTNQENEDSSTGTVRLSPAMLALAGGVLILLIIGIVHLFKSPSELTIDSSGVPPLYDNSSASTSEVQDSSLDVQSTTPNTQAEEEQPHRISIEDFQFEKHEEYTSFQYYQVTFTLKNNSEETLEDLTPDMVFLDENGTIVYHQFPTEQSRLRSGQSVVSTGLCELNLNPVEVFIDSFSYTINDEYIKEAVDEPVSYSLKFNSDNG